MNIDNERFLIIRDFQFVEDPFLLRAIKAMLDFGLKNEGHISINQ